MFFGFSFYPRFFTYPTLISSSNTNPFPEITSTNCPLHPWEQNSVKRLIIKCGRFVQRKVTEYLTHMWKHDDVIKWKHFRRHWPFVRGSHRSPVNSLHKGQWRGALMFSLVCAWINGWANDREASDLKRHLAHYDVTVMNTMMLVVVVIYLFFFLEKENNFPLNRI